jgi:hypothetical protein
VSGADVIEADVVAGVETGAEVSGAASEVDVVADVETGAEVSGVACLSLGIFLATRKAFKSTPGCSSWKKSTRNTSQFSSLSWASDTYFSPAFSSACFRLS